MYSDYAKNYQTYLLNFGSFLAGNGSMPSFIATIDFSYERNLLQNASSAETLIYNTNAMYDQVAAARTIKEIYKTPKDYFADYQTFLNKETANINFLATEVANQQTVLIDRMSISKSIKAFASRLQKKISLINPQV